MDAQMILTFIGGIIAAFAASSGLWALLLYNKQRKDQVADREQSDMQMIKDGVKGLLYLKILAEGERYIDRGYITVKEMDAFRTYIFVPYKELGGDGMADEVWESLTDLPRHEET